MSADDAKKSFIQQPVGEGAVNHAADVMVVQTALYLIKDKRNVSYYAMDRGQRIDGRPSAALNEAIFAFLRDHATVASVQRRLTPGQNGVAAILAALPHQWHGLSATRTMPPQLYLRDDRKVVGMALAVWLVRGLGFGLAGFTAPATDGLSIIIVGSVVGTIVDGIDELSGGRERYKAFSNQLLREIEKTGSKNVELLAP